jgi:hypothetical protein
MTLSEEIKPWIDPQTGMIQAADHGTDNLILGTAHLIALLPEGEDRSYWRFKAWMFLSNDVTVRTGLYRRYPGATGNNSVDNLVAAAYASSSHAFFIYIRGTKMHWCFDVENPDKFSWRYWYARFVGFPPFIKMAAGKKIGLMSQVLWSIACVYSALTPKQNTSDKLLQYLMNRVVGGRHWLCDRAISAWGRLMARKYPGGMRDVYAVYYAPTHPFAKYAPTDFL